LLVGIVGGLGIDTVVAAVGRRPVVVLVGIGRHYNCCNLSCAPSRRNTRVCYRKTDYLSRNFCKNGMNEGKRRRSVAWSLGRCRLSGTDLGTLGWVTLGLHAWVESHLGWVELGSAVTEADFCDNYRLIWWVSKV